MLTVLITRGQIIIRAGYFPAGCLYRKEATALGGGQAGGGRWRQAGRGAEGANPQPSALPEATGGSTDRGRGEAVQVQKV